MNRLFKSALVLGAVTTSLTFGSIQNAAAEPIRPPVQNTAHELNKVAPNDKVNKALEDVAKSLATTLQDGNVRTFVKTKIGERFDGDEEVLYTAIADTKLADGKMLKQKLAAGYVKAHAKTNPVDEKTAAEIINKHSALVPKLQFAMPVQFENWNAATHTPLVTYMPEGVEDTKVAQIKAFDANGNVHMLDAQNEPNYPVMVVSLNERTTTTESGAGMTLSHLYGDQEILDRIKINNDHEPWSKGSPEIFLSYSFGNSTSMNGRFSMEHVDDEGKWYYVNGSLFYWQQHYGDVMAVWLWEDDGGNAITATATYFGINFSTSVTDGDDALGHNPVSFSDPNNGYYSVGDGEYYLRHQTPYYY